MSLAVAILSRDCIVVGADRRTTITSQMGTRYSNETTKIFPMDSRVVIAYTGDNYVVSGFSVERFLISFKTKYFNQPSHPLSELPVRLLEEIQSLNADAHCSSHWLTQNHLELATPESCNSDSTQ